MCEPRADRLLGGRLRLLQPPGGHRAGTDAVPDDPVRVYLDAAQARGEVRADFPSQWIATTIQALAIAVLDDMYAGLVERDEGERLLAETLVAALLPR